MNVKKNCTHWSTLLTLLLIVCRPAFSQNSMIGDGFGGRLWYQPTNYVVGSYTGYAICGPEKQLYGWGANHHAQLANDLTIGTIAPVAIPGMFNIKFFNSGYLSTAIKQDGTGWAWGTASPILGSSMGSIPQQLLTGVKFCDASAYHGAFVKNDGTVWSIGISYGQFGNGTNPYYFATTPVQMSGITTAVRVACGGNWTVVLLADSTLVQAGPGSNEFQDVIHANANGYLPEVIPVLSEKIVDIKANVYAAYALTASGQVYSWGSDPGSYYGLLGNGGTHYDPRLIDFGVGASSIVAISACSDGNAMYALDESGNVYGVGWEYVLATPSNQFTPVLINSNCKDILCGETFGYVVKNDNSLWSTGGSLSNYPNGLFNGSIFMNQPNVTFPAFISTWVQLDPEGVPMNLCPPILLPIRLGDFSVVKQQQTAILKWSNETPGDGQRYFVERSGDAGVFTQISVLGGDRFTRKYQYVDHDPMSGMNYYRLRMSDVDGEVTFSEVRTARFDRRIDISLFPNPAINVVTMDFDALTAGSLVIKDINGKLLQVHRLLGSQLRHQLDVSAFAAGTYIITLVSGKEVVSRKMIIQR